MEERVSRDGREVGRSEDLGSDRLQSRDPEEERTLGSTLLPQIVRTRHKILLDTIVS